ncbi:hypothetical protein DFA_11203 [Cavenderia fasciculata]|uniref:Uncharacterized protein n=1 Tax=Cavenderia fasciculata TaxID=261658 RepID=F4QFD5_CACFS|nr:uncharacterized protein DFA_11203 [Cavenderia fasciculata]EGG13442.1 hypothetical protein DFA_11203 [Cavenderia fasciculata]|eukprot:XP_004350146.1 hypothetical protein DFA_11203 [Cavenderia fasciculata]
MGPPKNGKEDYVACFSFIGSEILAKMGTRVPPSYYMMATLLVVAGYTMGFPNYCQGRFIDTIKHTLVKMNKEIPRTMPDLAIKIQHLYNRYYGMVDRQRTIVWDKIKLTHYLKNNSIREYNPTRYPPTKENFERIIGITKLIMIDVYMNTFSKDKPVDDADSVEVILEKMGRMVLPHSNIQEDWAKDVMMNVLSVTLLAFQAGVVNYVYPPLIDGYLKSVVLDYLEYPMFIYKDDLN